MLTLSTRYGTVLLSLAAAFFLLACDTARDESLSGPSQLVVRASLHGSPDIAVNTTADVADFSGAQQVADLPGPDGLVSLREAITAANNTAGPQVIGFSIPTSDLGFDGTAFTIRPTSQLPAVTGGQTTIDGSTQAMATGNTNAAGPEIVLDGAWSSSAGGLSINSDGNVVHSLVVINFPFQGLGVYGNNNHVTGCFIGVGRNGSKAAGNGLNGEDGLQIDGSNNVIGGTTAELRNVISSNFRNGIALFSSATENFIQGNYVGTDATGTASVGGGNEDGGIAIFGGSHNLIGGAGPGEGNVISGNRGAEPMDAAGIFIVSGNENRIQGNFIGTDATGANALPNHNGIEIFEDVTGTVVGGDVAGAGNVISGNVHDGLTVDGSGNLIQGNLIGTDANGQTALPNNRGIQIRGTASNNLVGGIGADAGNRIAFNTNKGVVVRDGGTNGNSIRGNSIWLSGDLGIDLGEDGVTPNDSGDIDGGPNNLMNFPALSSAVASPGRLIVRGTIDTPNPATVTIEFFANRVPVPGGDPTGHGEGAEFLGTARPNPEGRFVAILPPVPPGTLISATATDAAGNTSEFSRNIEARLPTP